MMKASVKGAGKPKGAVPKRVTNAHVMEQLEVMFAQMKSLAMRTEVLETAGSSGGAKAAVEPGGGNISGVPAVSAGLVYGGPPATAFSKYTSLVGPPPKVKVAVQSHPKPVVPVLPEVLPAEESSLAMALTQQSSAVMALVSHFAGQSDPLTDIPGITAHSTSIRGVQKRERMQQDLAAGTSTYYLQVMQQLHKKLFPSLPLPKSVDELSHLSVLTYLERTGGYKHARDAGLLMWLLGYAVDAAAQGDLHQVRERLASMMVALDQSVVDGDWSVISFRWRRIHLWRCSWTRQVLCLPLESHFRAWYLLHGRRWCSPLSKRWKYFRTKSRRMLANRPRLQIPRIHRQRGSLVSQRSLAPIRSPPKPSDDEA